MNLQLEPVDQIKLFGEMKKALNTSELRILCFELGLNYEDLEGNNLQERILEFIRYYNRRGEITLVLTAMKRIRPRQNEYWNQIQAQLIEQRNKHLQESEDLENYTASLPEKSNDVQS